MWNMDGKEGFIQTLRLDVIQDRLNRVTNELQVIESQTDIDSNSSCFYDIIDDVCSPAFKKKLNNKKANNKHTPSKNQQWFDSECKEQQKHF